MSTHTETAREQARQADGRFGTQPAAESALELPDLSGARRTRLESQYQAARQESLAIDRARSLHWCEHHTTAGAPHSAAEADRARRHFDDLHRKLTAGDLADAIRATLPTAATITLQGPSDDSPEQPPEVPHLQLGDVRDADGTALPLPTDVASQAGQIAADLTEDPHDYDWDALARDTQWYDHTDEPLIRTVVIDLDKAAQYGSGK